MPLEFKDLHRLRAAHGYADLGMYADAGAELDEISPEHAGLPEILAVRVAIHAGLRQWDAMQAIAKNLAESDPANSQWPISWAYATRRAQSIAAAKIILLDAAQKHPDEPMIRYNLACYECQLGNLEVAKDLLDEALFMEPKCRAFALEDPDLMPLRGLL